MGNEMEFMECVFFNPCGRYAFLLINEELFCRSRDIYIYIFFFKKKDFFRCVVIRRILTT